MGTSQTLNLTEDQATQVANAKIEVLSNQISSLEKAEKALTRQIAENEIKLEGLKKEVETKTSECESISSKLETLTSDLEVLTEKRNECQSATSIAKKEEADALQVVADSKALNIKIVTEARITKEEIEKEKANLETQKAVFAKTKEAVAEYLKNITL